MRERTYFLPIFLISICFVFFLIFLGQVGIMGVVTSSVQTIFFPLGQLFHSQVVRVLPKTTSLQEENKKLHEQLVSQQSLLADNKALRDQFEITNPPPSHLLPVSIVGMPHALPAISFPDSLIINAGKRNGVSVGDVVISKNNAIGIITDVQEYFSLVQLVSSIQSSIPAVTSRAAAIGIAKGQGNGDIILDNVLLSQQLQVGDTVITKGSQEKSGKGYPPGLIIGKIMSINKNPSSLFQSASVVPLVAFDHLTMVFIVMQP